MIKTIATTILASISSNLTPNLENPPNTISPYIHPAPPGVDYSTNASPFGAILRGELPSLPILETSNYYAFHDRTPRAPLHALLIPKQQIDSILDLTSPNYHQLNEMKTLALQILQTYQREAYEKEDYILCFHIPPFYSVPHLHLHILAPASQMTNIMRNGKYRTGSRWCVGLDYALERLQQKKTVLPFGYPFLKQDYF